jgi:hypothetical protein
LRTKRERERERENVEVLQSAAGCTSFGHKTDRQTDRQTREETKKHNLHENTVDCTCKWKLQLIGSRRTEFGAACRMLLQMFTAHPAIALKVCVQQ